MEFADSTAIVRSGSFRQHCLLALIFCMISSASLTSSGLCQAQEKRNESTLKQPVTVSDASLLESSRVVRASEILQVQAESNNQVTPGPQPLDSDSEIPSIRPVRRRSSRRPIRIARAPNMFGDFFGTGGGRLGGRFILPGRLDGTVGGYSMLGSPSEGQFLTFGSTKSGTIPDLAFFTFGNGSSFIFDLDPVEDFSGARTLFIPASERQRIDVLTNSTETRAQYIDALRTAEESVPGVTFVDALLTTADTGLVEPPRGDEFRFSKGEIASIPFVVSTLIEAGIDVEIPTPGASGAVVGRTKIAENGSMVPRDRVFFDYSYFDNVPLASSGVNVNRFTPGFEKTFLDGDASIEVRVPMATTLSSDVDLLGVTNTSQGELGNIWLTLKAALLESEDFILTSGMSITLPTADDLNFNYGSMDLIRVQNESVHLMPFIGGIYTPNDRWFSMLSLQFDIDANCNPVSLNSTGMGLESVGRLDDSTFLFADASVGYWMYRNQSSSAQITGIAPMMELHYNRSIASSGPIAVGASRIGNSNSSFELLNAVFGATFELGRNRTLALAYSTPIGGGSDQQFDGEFRVLLNWFFGQQ